MRTRPTGFGLPDRGGRGNGESAGGVEFVGGLEEGDAVVAEAERGGVGFREAGHGSRAGFAGPVLDRLVEAEDDLLLAAIDRDGAVVVHEAAGAVAGTGGEEASLFAADLARMPQQPARGRGPVLFVLPSRDEGFGIVLLEAMRLGLPIIATNVGGIPEVVEDGVTGVVLKSGSAEEAADSIVDLLLAEGRWSDMSLAARHRYLSLFGPERWEREMLAVHS